MSKGVLAIGTLLALALAAFAAPSANADPSSTRSLTLHEGLNVVGWMGDPLSAADFAATLPDRPQAIFVRDTSGRWRLWSPHVPARLNTLRAIPSGAVVHLRIDAAPLGPWVYPQAASPPPSEIGPSLTPGSYQWVWHEPGKTVLGEAVRGLGDALERVWRWDALNQRSMILPMDATIRYGDVLTLEIGSPVYWARPTDEPTNIVWLGVVSSERKAQVRSAIEEARDWFADEYGIETAEFTAYYGDDIDAIISGYRRLEPELLDSGTEEWFRSEWDGGGIGIQQFDHLVLGGEPWGGGDEQLRIAAEYGYWGILRAWLADHLRSVDAWHHGNGNVPYWLTLGDSPYLRALFQGRSGNQRIVWLEQARKTSAPLSQGERYTAWRGVHWETQQGLATLAVAWLSAHAGGDSVVEFWRQLRYHDRWHDAFRSAFDLTPAAFYRSYEAWRADGFPPLAGRADAPTISGRVLDPNANPVANFQLDACPEDARSGGCVSTVTDADGRYTFRLPPNRYMLSATMDVRDCTVTRWFDGAGRDLSSHWSSTRLLSLHLDAVSGIDIELSALPGSAESAAWCDRGRPSYIGIEFVSLTGNLSGPDGPIGGVHLLACLDRDYPGRAGGVCYQGVSAADGDFYINVRKDARYQISVEPSWNRCIWHGWYADAGPTRERERSRTFTVGASPLSGVNLTLPALPSELPSWSDRCNWSPD